MQICGKAVIGFYIFLFTLGHQVVFGNGIVPEEIYQSTIDWKNLVGTWEVLPERNFLGETPEKRDQSTERILMTLRVDGTCRLFNRDHPTGLDGLWEIENHGLVIRLTNGRKLESYVYGVKGDFMIARSDTNVGKDVLWSRVK